MAGFSKVFSTMWGGSLYGRFEASAVFLVFLSLSDKNGEVDMTPEAIAGLTGWPIKLIKSGIAELAAPDERSRTPDEEGRRIVLLDQHRDWGWRITNYAKYRDEMRSQERREYLREAKRKERSKARQHNVNKSTSVNRNQPIAEAEAEAYTEAEKRGSTRRATAQRLPDDFQLTPERRAVAEAEKVPAERTFEKFCDYWRSEGGQKARKHDWDATWRNWCRRETSAAGKANGSHRLVSMDQLNRMARDHGLIRRQGEPDDAYRDRVMARVGT